MMEAIYYVYTHGHSPYVDYDRYTPETGDPKVDAYLIERIRWAGQYFPACRKENRQEKESWIVIRHKGYTLCGVLVWNEVLLDTTNQKKPSDDQRPHYGFYGILSKNEERKEYPYSSDFYRSLYIRHVAPKLGAGMPKDFMLDRIPVREEYGNAPTLKAGTAAGWVNKDTGKCRIWPDTESEKEMLEQALSCPGDIACISGYFNEGLSDTAFSLFNNVIIKGKQESKDFSVAPKTGPELPPRPYRPQSTTGIELSHKALVLPQGKVYRLTASVQQAGWMTPEVEWTSSNPSIVSVDSYGNLFAVTPGVTDIIVRCSPDCTAVCKVTVTDAARERLKKVLRPVAAVLILLALGWIGYQVLRPSPTPQQPDARNTETKASADTTSAPDSLKADKGM